MQMALFIIKKIFNKLNLEIPETWSEFIEILETAKKKKELNQLNSH